MNINIVLPGGGAKGARQAGALKAIDEAGHTIKSMSCCSVGTLNAIGYISHGSEWLYNLWHNIKNKHIYKSWWLGIPYGALFKTGLYNTKPLRDLLKNSVDIEKVKNGIPLFITTANLNTGQIEYFSQDSKHLIEAAMASSAFPIAFETVKIGKSEYTDGGVREQDPIKILENMPGKTMVIHTGTNDINPKVNFGYTMFGRAMRIIDMMATEIKTDDDHSHKDIIHNYPKNQMVPDSLDFERGTRAAMEEGYTTTKELLKTL